MQYNISGTTALPWQKRLITYKNHKANLSPAAGSRQKKKLERYHIVPVHIKHYYKIQIITKALSEIQMNHCIFLNNHASSEFICKNTLFFHSDKTKSHFLLPPTNEASRLQANIIINFSSPIYNLRTKNAQYGLIFPIFRPQKRNKKCPFLTNKIRKKGFLRFPSKNTTIK